MFNTTIRRQTSVMSPDEEGVDPREIDKVLVEAASMAGRWNLFRKFLCESMTVRHAITLFVPLPLIWFQGRL